MLAVSDEVFVEKFLPIKNSMKHYHNTTKQLTIISVPLLYKTI